MLILNFIALIYFLNAQETTETSINGISDKDLNLYTANELKCPSSGKVITLDKVNDGICDCPEDGFDEPGTAACEKAKFFCKNLNGIEKYIPSFMVNDGVCDCCDGSDEYSNQFGIKCENTCEELKKTIVRTSYLERTRQKKAQKYFEFSKSEAQNQQNELKSELSRINTEIEELETKIKLMLDDKSPDDMETIISEYKLKTEQLEAIIFNLTRTEAHPPTSEGTFAKEDDIRTSFWDRMIDSRLKFAKNVISKMVYQPATTTVTKYLPTVITKTVVQYQPTKTFDDQVNDLNYEKDELLDKAKNLEINLKDRNVYGPDLVFLSLRNKCFDHKSGLFTYTLCWFDSVKQKQNSNNAEYDIGKWSHWRKASRDDFEHSGTEQDENEDNDYKTMIYNGGNWCDTVERTSKVNLVCGWKNEIESVEETSKCIYEFKFSTPLACVLHSK